MGDGLEKPREVIWIQTAFIGDVVLTTGAINLLQKKFPDVPQYLITTPQSARFMAQEKSLTKVFSFNKRLGARGLLSVVSEVRKELGKEAEGRWIIQPHKSFRSTLLAKMIGGRRSTYRQTSDFGLRTWTGQERVAVFHESTRIALLLQSLGFTRSELIESRPILTAVTHKRPELGKDKWIAIAPGSVWATKRWTIEGYAQLATDILREGAYKILILGGPGGDETAAGLVLKQIPSALRTSVENLAGKTQLEEMAAIFPYISGIVCGDSAPLHFAQAYSVPCVAVFGSTIPEMGFGPLSTRSRVAQVERLSCRPCGIHGHNACPLGHFRCMKEVGSARVKNLLSEVLSG